MDGKIAVLADEWGFEEETLHGIVSSRPSLLERVEALPDGSVDLEELNAECKLAAIGE